MTKPKSWVAIIAFRYIRIMPMYLLAVLYSKHIAKYTNGGPVWDYATSSLSQRRICEQESWLWTLLFGANFKTPLAHCIPGGWYLANDFQFFLITPVFLILLHKYPALGRRFTFATIAVGFLGGMISILASEVDDLIPIARFMPHGFKSYLSNLHNNYTRPYYRIPAFLCGIYIGYLLYEYEQKKLAHRAALKKDPSLRVEEPDWSEAFKRYCVPFSGLLVAICCVTPYVASYLPFSKLFAKIMVSLITPTYHLAFSVAVGLFILSMATGDTKTFTSRFLSAPQWKPLSRLSLCALLTNVEVIIYITQGRRYLHPMTAQYLMSFNLLSIIITYCASIVVCVIVESPLRNALKYVALTLFNLSRAKRMKQQIELDGCSKPEAISQPAN